MNALARGLEHRFDDLIRGVRIRSDEVKWPQEADISGERFNGNNLYKDLRGKTWGAAEQALRLENAFFSRIVQCQSSAQEERLVRRMSILERMLDGLDLGTASTVYAISAAGGVPITSCNGGCFGGRHNEPFPVVGFWWPRSKLPLLRQSAKQAGVSMWVHHRGELVAGARTIRRLSLFAAAILERRAIIEARASSPR